MGGRGRSRGRKQEQGRSSGAYILRCSHRQDPPMLTSRRRTSPVLDLCLWSLVPSSSYCSKTFCADRPALSQSNTKVYLAKDVGVSSPPKMNFQHRDAEIDTRSASSTKVYTAREMPFPLVLEQQTGGMQSGSRLILMQTEK